MRFAVRLTPRAGVDQVVGVGPDGALGVRVRAAPHDGEANEALLRVLASHLDIPRTALALVGGAAGRRKLVEIDPAYDGRLARAWPELAR